MNSKIALCFIAKDREKILPRMLNSTEGVFDYYCMADTGSSDNTIDVFVKWCEKHNKEYRVSKGKEYKTVDVNGNKTLGDFGSARNDSFDLAKEAGTNYAFWMDTDDILINPNFILKAIDIMQGSGAQMGVLTYIYAKAHAGVKPIVQKRERIIDLSVPGKWMNRVHEVYNVESRISIAEIKDIWLEHERGVDEVLETGRRNSLIMHQELDEVGIDKLSDQVLTNLAYDHWEHKEYNEAIEYYQALLKRPNKPSELLFQILIKLAYAYLGLSDVDNAVLYANKALPHSGPFADPYSILADCYSRMGKWDEVLYFADKILQMGVPDTSIPVNEFEYIVIPRRFKINAYLNKNDIGRALEEVNELVRVYPSEDSFKDKMMIENDKITSDTIMGLYNVIKYMQANNLMKYADRLREAIPIPLLDHPTVRNLIKELMYDFKHKSERVRLKGKKSIVIWAGGGVIEPWDGRSDIDKGIGGSEGMCIQLSRELAKLGNKVVIYNDCGSSAGKEFDGVLYEHYSKFNDALKSDIFISLRDPSIFGKMIKAKKTYLWLHDTHYGNYPTSFFYTPNKVIVLSQAHKQIIKEKHNIGDDSIFWVSRNGLNPLALEEAKKNATERDLYKVIYASSYDRGLDNVLAMWPKIKEKVPQATLDIYYGWNTYDAMMQARMQQNDPQGKQMYEYKQKIVDQIVGLEGVRELGKVSQSEIYTKMAEAGVWFYCTEFFEISCITAMSAQALGAIPVCTPYAALIETVNSKYGYKYTLDGIADGLIYALQHQEDLEKRRKPMMKWAKKAFDMGSLAKDWDDHFNND